MNSERFPEFSFYDVDAADVLPIVESVDEKVTGYGKIHIGAL